MPQVKPGRWSVNPADIELRFLDLWRGLIFAAPIWGGQFLEDVVTHTLSTDQDPAVYAAPEDGVPGIGIAVENTSGGGQAYSWPNHPVHGGRISVADGQTWFALVDIYGTSSSPGRIFHYENSDSAHGFFTTGGEVPFFIYDQTQVDLTSSQQGNGFRFWVGRWDGVTAFFEIYDLSGTLIESNSASVSTKVSDATGEIIIGNSPAFGESVASRVGGAFMWDRYLGDGVIRQLFQDPFGLFRQELFVTPDVAGTSYSFTDIGLTGSLVDLQIDNAAATTILVSGGEQPSSIEEISPATATITGSVTVTVTVTDIDGNAIENVGVRVEEDENPPRTLISNGLTNSSGIHTFSFTASTPQNVRVVARLKGWKPGLNFETIASGIGVSSTFSFEPDPTVNLP